MGRGRLIVLAAMVAGGLALTARGGAEAPGLDRERARLASAKRDAAAAAARAEQLARAADAERDAARKAAAERAALAERVAAAAAAVTAADARVALVNRLLAAQQARLARAEAPVTRLLGGLASLARRPAVVALAQPGSVGDLVHVRAVLGSALPVVRQQTEGVRRELVRTRALLADAALAGEALRSGRVRLEAERTALAKLEAQHRARAGALVRQGLSESDRALALGEQARDLVDGMEEAGAAAATAADLAGLPGPVPRPLARDAVLPPAPRGVYRLPAEGRVVTGEGELSGNGVRSRGVTLAVRAGARVVAPAGGTVRFAGVFRGYRAIVIIDHGAGWTSLVTGMARAGVRRGASVRMGTPIGVAQGGDAPLVTVELRREGRPVDLASLVG